jgi:HEAT repeat protein
LGDRDGRVRLAACKYFAGIVSKDAVPELLARLKDDNEAVRNAAADALQKIRFYQEQQAHWDRILKGVDASAGTVTEKLLVQAKPGQPKEQRVLAIQSLAAVGAPEALPFLIDWLGDQDADVAAAARAAVGTIHQRAGVK